jgi:hypothetical protein
MTYNNHHKHAKKQNENIAYFLKTSKAEIITKVTLFLKGLLLYFIKQDISLKIF